MLRRLTRLLIVLLGLTLGFILTFYGLQLYEALANVDLDDLAFYGLLAAGVLIGAGLAHAAAPTAMRELGASASVVEVALERTPIQDIAAGAVGLLVGLIVANLFGSALARIPVMGGFLPTISSLAFGSLGLYIGLLKKDEMNLSRLFRRGRDRRAQAGAPKLLDTNVIIDGRFVDILEAGFLEGPLVVPQFVLEELQRIADSSDPHKRARGRRGLEVLKRVRGNPAWDLRIDSRDHGHGGDVDGKLVRMAKATGAKLVSIDQNLNRIAELQGVPVLNIHGLTLALRPSFLPGEEIEIQVLREGSQPGQGVGYLEDGTMVVVDGGCRSIGATIEVVVTNVMSTAQGRIVFARPRPLPAEA